MCDWLQAAAQLPLAFGQVREDALLDAWVVERLPAKARVLMVASGGCTAALLAGSSNVERLHLVDPNPAQLALTQVKLHLRSQPIKERLQILGHAKMEPSARKGRLAGLLGELGLANDALGPPDLIAKWGPDHAGRYERLFDQLRASLEAHREELMRVLHLRNLEEQYSAIGPNTRLGAALDQALDKVMALDNLVNLFGAEATNNPVEPFSRHFARRIRHAFASMPAVENPYLWQMLAGQFAPGVASPWLSVKPASKLPSITYTRSMMAEVLAAHHGEFDFLHLSNILDWLNEEAATNTLKRAWQALRPGGWLIIRQLNSSLKIRALGDFFSWCDQNSHNLHARDRSFFYRELHLGRKQ